MKGPQYGTQATWGGDMAKQAMKIREETFKNRVHKCDRLDKTLVYCRMRNSLPTQQQQLLKTHVSNFT